MEDNIFSIEYFASYLQESCGLSEEKDGSDKCLTKLSNITIGHVLAAHSLGTFTDDDILQWIRKRRKLTPLIEKQFILFRKLAKYLISSVMPEDVDAWKEILNDRKYIWPTETSEGWASVFGDGEVPDLCQKIDVEQTEEKISSCDQIKSEILNESENNQKHTTNEISLVKEELWTSVFDEKSEEPDLCQKIKIEQTEENDNSIELNIPKDETNVIENENSTENKDDNSKELYVSNDETSGIDNENITENKDDNSKELYQSKDEISVIGNENITENKDDNSKELDVSKDETSVIESENITEDKDDNAKELNVSKDEASVIEENENITDYKDDHSKELYVSKDETSVIENENISGNKDNNSKELYQSEDEISIIDNENITENEDDNSKELDVSKDEASVIENISGNKDNNSKELYQSEDEISIMDNENITENEDDNSKELDVSKDERSVIENENGDIVNPDILQIHVDDEFSDLFHEGEEQSGENNQEHTTEEITLVKDDKKEITNLRRGNSKELYVSKDETSVIENKNVDVVNPEILQLDNDDEDIDDIGFLFQDEDEDEDEGEDDDDDEMRNSESLSTHNNNIKQSSDVPSMEVDIPSTSSMEVDVSSTTSMEVSEGTGMTTGAADPVTGTVAFWCVVCNLCAATQKLLTEHKARSRHKRKLLKKLKSAAAANPAAVIKINGEYWCEICSLSTSTQKLMTKHKNESSSHKLLQKLKQQEDCFVRDPNSWMLKCLVCNMEMDSSKELDAHLAGDMHKSRAKDTAVSAGSRKKKRFRSSLFKENGMGEEEKQKEDELIKLCLIRKTPSGTLLCLRCNYASRSVENTEIHINQMHQEYLKVKDKGPSEEKVIDTLEEKQKKDELIKLGHIRKTPSGTLLCTRCAFASRNVNDTEIHLNHVHKEFLKVKDKGPSEEEVIDTPEEKQKKDELIKLGIIRKTPSGTLLCTLCPFASRNVEDTEMHINLSHKEYVKEITKEKIILDPLKKKSSRWSDADTCKDKKTKESITSVNKEDDLIENTEIKEALENGIARNVTDDVYHCTLCNVNKIGLRVLLWHVQSDQHKQNMKNFNVRAELKEMFVSKDPALKDGMKYLQNKGSSILCKVCNVKIYKIKYHIQSSEHKLKLKTFSKSSVSENKTCENLEDTVITSSNSDSKDKKNKSTLEEKQKKYELIKLGIIKKKSSGDLLCTRCIFSSRNVNDIEVHVNHIHKEYLKLKLGLAKSPKRPHDDDDDDDDDATDNTASAKTPKLIEEKVSGRRKPRWSRSERRRNRKFSKE